jgi:hypothetical protein
MMKFSDTKSLCTNIKLCQFDFSPQITYFTLISSIEMELLANDHSRYSMVYKAKREMNKMKR